MPKKRQRTLTTILHLLKTLLPYQPIPRTQKNQNLKTPKPRRRKNRIRSSSPQNLRTLKITM